MATLKILLPILAIFSTIFIYNISEAAFAEDNLAAFNVISAVVCSGTLDDKTLSKWASCAKIIPTFIPCRKKIYGVNFDSKANVAKFCNGGDEKRQRFLTCIDKSTLKLYGTEEKQNENLRKIVVCEKGLLGLQ